MKFFDKPLIMCSMFSAPAFLDRTGHGKGGKWMDATSEFIDRKQEQNCDGGRVPLESCFWNDRDNDPTNDHPFFNKNRASSGQVWDYNALAHGHRPTELTYYQQFIILHLIRLAKEKQFKMNFITDFTMKHAIYNSRVISWDTIGHCIRQVSHYLNLIHESNMDGNKVAPKLQELFTKVMGPIDDLIHEEHHNEFDAHSQASWRASYQFNDDGSENSPEKIRAKALREINLQLSRSDNPDRQWDEGTVSTSHGGRDDVEYNIGPSGSDVANLHPSRGGDWSRVGNRFAHLEKYHVYHSETKHYIDPSLWRLVEDGWFRPASSTQDKHRLYQFENDCRDRGHSFCRHSLVNMACGYWVRGNDWGHESLERMPLDEFEIMTKGDTPPPPPPPPPPPVTMKLKGKMKFYGWTVPFTAEAQVIE